MKRWILIIVLVAVLVWLVVGRSSGPESGGGAAAPSLRSLDVGTVVDYADRVAGTLRVKTARDVLPCSLSAAMAPAMVSWADSDFGTGGTVVLGNVNHGGNPVSGTTVLRTIRVRPELISGAEYVMVPLGGPHAVSHGQLRFHFERGGVELLTPAEGVAGEPDAIDNLVLSWEAWRAPGVDFSVLTGMQGGTYQLSMRAYSGTQRFLEDALMHRDWYVSPLRLPGGARAAAELFRVAIALGDGAARSVIADCLEHSDESWVQSGPSSEVEGGDAAAIWRELRERMHASRAPDADPRVDLTGQTGYQTMLRSCATMALYTIDLTVTRQIEAGAAHAGMRPTQTPEVRDEPDWMASLATANVAGLFVRAPRALGFIVQNPTSIPGKIPGALNAAGLVEQQDGRRIERHFTIDGETPWGPREHLLIR